MLFVPYILSNQQMNEKGCSSFLEWPSLAALQVSSAYHDYGSTLNSQVAWFWPNISYLNPIIWSFKNFTIYFAMVRKCYGQHKPYNVTTHLVHGVSQHKFKFCDSLLNQRVNAFSEKMNITALTCITCWWWTFSLEDDIFVGKWHHQSLRAISHTLTIHTRTRTIKYIHQTNFYRINNHCGVLHQNITSGFLCLLWFYDTENELMKYCSKNGQTSSSSATLSSTYDVTN